MRVYLGSDHAGFELKNHLVDWLKANGHEPVDCGPHIYDAATTTRRSACAPPSAPPPTPTPSAS